MAVGKGTGLIKKFAIIFLGSACLIEQGWPLHTKPWLGNVYEFEWDGAFTYSRYHKVQDASVQLKHASNDKLYAWDLGFTASDSMDIQAEVEFADTPRQCFSWRSVALQGRYLWLNDVEGDSCSVITGFNIREVNRRSVRDVSSPYHYYLNFELNTAIGKEWSNDNSWTMRTYGFGALGTANRGSPWLKAMGVWEANVRDTHRFLLDIEGYFGCGDKKHVDVDHFHGWARVHHQSIDLAIGYAYHMQIWGTWGLRYAHRIFAKSFPEHVNFITLFYRLPFSIF
jgi:hypothetical protein